MLALPPRVALTTALALLAAGCAAYEAPSITPPSPARIFDVTARGALPAALRSSIRVDVSTPRDGGLYVYSDSGSTREHSVVHAWTPPATLSPGTESDCRSAPR